MSETSVEERSHEARHRAREPQATSITEGGHRHRAASVPAPSKNEILQVMFWVKVEGFGDQADVTLLERFLGADVHIDVERLDRLLDEGYVERVGHSYKLTEAGTRKGGQEFAASFEELMKPTYGECGRNPSCIGMTRGECRAGLDGDGSPACSPATSLRDT